MRQIYNSEERQRKLEIHSLKMKKLKTERENKPKTAEDIRKALHPLNK